MRTALMLMVASLLALGTACKKDGEPAPAPVAEAKPATDTTGGTKTGVVSKVDLPGPTEAAEAVAPAEPVKPKKLAELDSFDLMDGIKAAGWESGGAGGMAQGEWSTTNITAKKGGAEAKITFIAPTGQPADTKSTIKLQTPKEAAPGYEKRGAAVLLRDEALLAVEIEGKPDDAKLLLDQIVAALPLLPADGAAAPKKPEGDGKTF